MLLQKTVLLKDRLPLIKESNLPFWIVTEFPDTPGEKFVLSMAAPIDLDLRFNPVRAKASDIGKMKAQKFGDLLKMGVKPGEAAHRLHTSVKALMSRPETNKVVQDIIEGYTYDAGVRKLLQRALVNRGVLENSLPEGDKKLLVDYLKMLGSDTEVGIEAPAQVNVSVGIEPGLKALLDATVPVPLLPEPAIDAETEDVPTTT